MRCMRYFISRQWSALQDFDITGESGDLRYEVRGNFGFTQSLTVTELGGQRLPGLEVHHQRGRPGCRRAVEAGRPALHL